MNKQEVVDEYLAKYKPQAERISELEAEVKKLKSLVADLETVIDDIPPFHKVWKAVQELQEASGGSGRQLDSLLGGRR